MKKETVIMKFPLDAAIEQALQREADRLGLKVNAYIKMVLGQHVILLEERDKKSPKVG